MAQRAAWNKQQAMHHEMGGRGAHAISGEHAGADLQQAAWYAAHGMPVPGHAHQQQHPDASTILRTRSTEPKVAREMAGEDLTLQGNLEPDVLFEPVENIKREVRAMITEFGGTKRYIVNLGHGTKPDMSVEAVGAFVEEAQRIA
ncbi:hypothetical protein AMAG_04999 [Allomyces macrogynus ATCC 38327]|uniref:Uroporphyrinogen decarboxylase (URO-D) domain-containing protein n=1 Tax=Allomyces macrogynus (strain ATCC 38327) TaxID=578462 RepID=A0A0L0S6Y0_ALLM3|nr:hypothetical protein AMAG_04999 [Allomyces macrogynus ATCC 38327]|eukprot:KNE58185.1 hypothetical protein AMAG_04999 [Allomyces macrogynus ATCC 38327]